jgi:signal transduction histidine kinase
MHPCDRATADAAVSAHIHGTSPFVEIDYRLADGNGSWRWFRERGRVVERDADGRPTRATGTRVDITEHREREEQLSQSQKLEAVGQLAGGVAHDFNNLITSIAGHARLALDALPEDSVVADDLAAIVRDARRGSELTRQLLSFARKETDPASSVEVVSVLRELRRLLIRVIGEDVALELRTPDEPLWMRTDRTQLEQIVINLVVNARDAVSSGGRIGLRASRVRQLPDGVLQPAGSTASGGHVLVEVTDDGPGIPDHILPRIFDPFFTTKPPSKGTGLGLSTVHRIVRQCEGAIDVDSRNGGTVFRVYLPEKTEGGPEEPCRPSSSARLDGRGRTVLLVEDEPAVRSVASRVLRRAGFRVLEAEDGEEALRHLARADAVDLLLTDLVMPAMGGAALAATVRQDRPALPVIFTSGYADDHPELAAGLPEGGCFLPKPYSPADLLACVTAAVRD